MPMSAPSARPTSAARPAALLAAVMSLATFVPSARAQFTEADVPPLRVDPEAFTFDDAVFLQAGSDLGSVDMVAASNRPTYRYFKLGIGLARADSADFSGVTAQDLGFQDVVQDFTQRDEQGNIVQQLEDVVLRAYSTEPTTIQSDEAFGPAVNAALGMDFALGEQGGKIRPRLEVEYLFRDALLNQSTADITYQDALRDFTGNLVFQGGQTVAGPISTVPVSFGDSEIYLHTIGINGTLTFEVVERIRPFVGAGVGMTYGYVELLGLEGQSDTGVEIGLLGGVIISLSEEFELELGGRWSTVDLQLYGEEIEIQTLMASAALIVRF